MNFSASLWDSAQSSQTSHPKKAKKKAPPKPKKTPRKKVSPAKKSETKKPLPSPSSSSASIILPITEKMSILDKELPKELKRLDDIVAAYGSNAHKFPPGSVAHSPEAPVLEVTEKSLIFSGKKLPGMALIKILESYWIFLDRKYPMEIPKKYPFGIEAMTDQSTDTNTILKMRLSPSFWPNLAAEKNRWIIDFSITPRLSRTKKVIRMPNTIDKPIKILMPSYVSEIAWQHPDTKIPYSIFTSKKQDGAFTPLQNFPQLTLMESYVGLGLHPKTDSLVVQRDVEDINIFDAKGMTASDDVLTTNINSIVFADQRTPYKINVELQKLKNVKQTTTSLLRQIQLGLHLGFFSEVGVNIKKLESLCQKGAWSDQGIIDFMKLVLLTLSPHDENAKESIDFVNHSQQSAEFAFWYNIYKRTPQNYDNLVKSVLSTYPTFLKNKVAEIMLTLPDEYENLRSILNLKGLHKDLRERARLKLALMQPMDMRELQELSEFSPQREIQAKAKLELILDHRKEKNFDATAAINDLEPFLFSFGDKSFEAKTLLSQLYVEKRDYTKAIRLLKDLALEEKNRDFDLKEHMKKAYLSFFQDIFDKKDKKPGLEKFNPHPLDIIAFFNDFKHLTPEGEAGTKILETVVDAMRSLSLYKPAIEILNKQTEQVKEEVQKKDLLFTVAELHLDNLDAESAEKVLMGMDLATLTEEKTRKRRDLLIDTYLLKNAPTKALSLVNDLKDTNSLLQKERILWFMKDFDGITAFVPPMINLADGQDKKAELVTHLAIANVLVKNPPFSFIDLRQRFQSLVKGTAFEKDFLMATTPEIMIPDGLRHFGALDGLLMK
ncbi:MAG: hypothetical protein K2X98_04050 [Alphaproteobacteria bacterium]|nr:hypothetical protein [Alphaproteobacteria bacterium]